MPSQLRIAVVLFFCAGLLPWASPARAIILYSSPNRNETVDTSSIAYPAWQLEGQFAGFIGTPIASQYFITAKHIIPGNLAANPIVFQSQSYQIDTSYASGGVRLDPNSDLAIVKIQEAFPTFANLYTGNQEVGKTMVVIGRGTQRGGDVVVDGQPQGWYWGAADGVQSWG